MSIHAGSITIREARSHEAAQLSELALRSKGHWGYSAEFLAACVDELTIHAQQIEDEQLDVVVAERNGEVAGFYALARVAETNFELQALFVEPEHIGSGIGRSLMNHALCRVASQSGTTLLIQGDPHAEEFYLAAGARLVGSSESGSIPGRRLPVYEITIT